MTELIPVCPLCGGRVVKQETEKIIRVGQDVVILKVQAGVCQHCGEKIYTKETHDRIQKIRKELKERISELKPVGRTYIYGT